MCGFQPFYILDKLELMLGVKLCWSERTLIVD